MERAPVTKLYELDCGIFDYDPSVPCLRGAIDGFMVSENFRMYMDRGLELFKEKSMQHSKLGWLADTSKALAFVPEDTEWLANDWNVRALDAGIRYVAFVMPKEIFAEMSVNEYSDIAPGGMIVRHFSDLEMAKTWLRSILKLYI